MIQPAYTLLSDAELGHVLRRNDPIRAPSHEDIADLQHAILSVIDRTPGLKIPVEFCKPTWIMGAWLTRVAAAASVLIIVSGFVIGQLSYGGNSILNTTSLLAFTDTTLMQALPTPDDGDNDDDAE